MNETRTYRLMTRLVPAGRTRDGYRSAHWVAELQLEGWSQLAPAAVGEGESERDAVNDAMVALRG